MEIRKKYRFVFHSVAREVICGFFNRKDYSLKSHPGGFAVSAFLMG